MHALFAAEVLVPAVGGAERAMLEWADGLRARGHVVETVFLEPAPRPGPERYWRWRAEQRAAVGALAARALASATWDVVVAQHHCAPAAVAAADDAGVPGVLVLPSYEGLCKLAFDSESDCPADGDCVTCPAPGRLEAPERAALAAGRREHDGAIARAAALVVPSRPMAETVRRWSGRDATVVWPVGPAPPAPASAAPEGPVVCAASSWTPHKGAALLPALVAAVRETAPRTVHVTGDGLDPTQRKAVRAAGGTLVSPAPIDELLAGASLVLVPSQWEEPFGRIAWESLARGVPVLASAAGGLTDAVPAELRVAPRDDPRAWRAAIRRLLGDGAVWRAAQDSGRECAARLASPPPLERLEALLTEVATGGRATSARPAGRWAS